MNFLKRLYNVGKPKVTFSSTVEGLEKISPILPANKVLPQWFKDIKAVVAIPSIRLSTSEARRVFSIK